MADDDQTSTPDGESGAGTTVAMADFPAITEALLFSSADGMLASLGIDAPSADDTAVA